MKKLQCHSRYRLESGIDRQADAAYGLNTKGLNALSYSSYAIIQGLIVYLHDFKVNMNLDTP